jgi:membrane-associated phospholipid phosphatase
VEPPNITPYPLVKITRPGQDIFEQQQLKFLDTYADLRSDRAAEILCQENGAMAFLASIPFLHPDKTKWTLELLAAALRLARFAEMRFKHALACRRPNEYSPQVQPMILTPSHGTLPMGHACEAFVSAYVLWQVLKASGTEPYHTKAGLWGLELMHLANRVAVNRIVAGLHFPVDAVAGMVLGLTLGQYFVNWCSLSPDGNPQGACAAWAFDGTKFTIDPDPNKHLDGDFHWDALFDPEQPAGHQQQATDYANLITDPQGNPIQPQLMASPILYWMWEQAVTEWTQ